MIDPRDFATVPAWNPDMSLSDAVVWTPKVEQFMERARAEYRADPIEFGEPEELMVSGRHFSVISRQSGLVEAPVHTIPGFRWRQVFEPIARISFSDRPRVLVSASAGHGNYYHWLSETIAAALMYRAMQADGAIPLVVPTLGEGWRREALATLAIDNPLVEVSIDEAMVCQGGVLSSLTGPGNAFAPHPAVLALMQQQRLTGEERRSDNLLLYVSRRDAGDRRRMVNEQDLCSALKRLGFTIVTAGQMPVAEQMALFRKARLIVSPHGAALSNLLFAASGQDGPSVVELFQENYLNRCFLKICQGKRLSYHAVVSPTVTQGMHHHQSDWRADLNLIIDVIQKILRNI